MELIHFDRAKKELAAQQPEKEPEKVYSVAEVARLMSVSKNTVYKWLCIDDPEARLEALCARCHLRADRLIRKTELEKNQLVLFHGGEPEYADV